MGELRPGEVELAGCPGWDAAQVIVEDEEAGHAERAADDGGRVVGHRRPRCVDGRLGGSVEVERDALGACGEISQPGPQAGGQRLTPEHTHAGEPGEGVGREQLRPDGRREVEVVDALGGGVVGEGVGVEEEILGQDVDGVPGEHRQEGVPVGVEVEGGGVRHVTRRRLGVGMQLVAVVAQQVRQREMRDGDGLG